MNNPAHNDSHFNRHAEQLARSAERQRNGRDVPRRLVSDVEQEMARLLHDEEQN